MPDDMPPGIEVSWGDGAGRYRDTGWGPGGSHRHAGATPVPGGRHNTRSRHHSEGRSPFPGPSQWDGAAQGGGGWDDVPSGGGWGAGDGGWGTTGGSAAGWGNQAHAATGRPASPPASFSGGWGDAAPSHGGDAWGPHGGNAGTAWDQPVQPVSSSGGGWGAQQPGLGRPAWAQTAPATGPNSGTNQWPSQSASVQPWPSSGDTSTSSSSVFPPLGQQYPYPSNGDNWGAATSAHALDPSAHVRPSWAGGNVTPWPSSSGNTSASSSAFAPQNQYPLPASAPANGDSPYVYHHQPSPPAGAWSGPPPTSAPLWPTAHDDTHTSRKKKKKHRSVSPSRPNSAPSQAVPSSYAWALVPTGPQYPPSSQPPVPGSFQSQQWPSFTTPSSFDSGIGMMKPAEVPYPWGDGVVGGELGERPSGWRKDFKVKPSVAGVLRRISSLTDYSMGLRPTLHAHIHYNNSRPPVVFDLRAPPRPENIYFSFTRRTPTMSDLTTRLACEPPVPFMRLYHERLPWYIDVGTANSAGVTLMDIFWAMHTSLMRQIREEDLGNAEVTGHLRRKIEAAYFVRCGSSESMRMEGVKRIDFLRKRVLFEGISKGKRGMWEMKTKSL
ncbi:hypothetical protein PLICRDRAFT_299652 [Plicaturopsis crispa FD-325 SS-3]|nr:hypothetical protein PLICRDRAFT_299652 [Plicaturopsis crispa FD-325 SS-3]